MKNAFYAAFFGLFAIAGIACSSSSSDASSDDAGLGSRCVSSLPANAAACPAASAQQSDVGRACAPGGTQCFYPRVGDGADGGASCQGPIEYDCRTEDGGVGDATTGTWTSSE